MAKPDLSEFDALSAPKRKPCAVKAAVEQLGEDDRVNVTGALHAPMSRITAGAIEKWFAKRNHTVNQNAITVHRKARCACASE